MSPSSSCPRRKPISRVRKHIAVLKQAMSQKHAGWLSKDWNSKSNWQRSAVEDAGQSSQDKRESSKPRAKWKEISHTVEELGTLVKEKKSTWIKGCVRKEKPKYASSEGIAENANVEDGDKSRLRKALKQLRKDREEESTARELLEEMEQNVNEAQERASVRIGAEFVQGARGNSCTHGNEKIWQMMQSNNTKSDNLESDLTDILETASAGAERNGESDQSFG